MIKNIMLFKNIKSYKLSNDFFATIKIVRHNSFETVDIYIYKESLRNNLSLFFKNFNYDFEEFISLQKNCYLSTGLRLYGFNDVKTFLEKKFQVELPKELINDYVKLALIYKLDWSEL